MNMTTQMGPEILMPALLGLLIGGLVAFSGFRKFTGLERSEATVLWFGSMVLAGITAVYRRGQITISPFFGHRQFDALLTLLCTEWLVLLIGLFATKMYMKWVGGRLSDEEKLPGMNGVRAWLRGGNLVCAVLIAVGAALGMGYSFWATLAATTVCLVAYPLLNTLSQASPEPVETKGFSAERERVLQMLEQGKINATESAELLNALGQTVQPTRPQSIGLNPSRKTVLIGVTLVLLGFFLPWFSFNPGNEVDRQLQNLVPNFPGADFMQNAPLHIKTGSVTITGGDVRHGLGWLVLLLGISVAALPYLALRLDSHTERMLVVGALGLGALIMLFLLTQNFRFVSIGLLLGLVGYALEFFGTVNANRTSASRVA